MGAKLYKYTGADVVDKAFSKDDKCSFKCSYPKDFNDPYELFLTIDYDQDAELLAFYQETIGNIPQLPTTCFSKSPDVVPMWAHYSHNHSGVVIEVDEEKLSEAFPDIGFGDIDYRNEPDEDILDLLHRAIVTCKTRHTYLLQRGVFGAAYYTKNTCWNYEQERRLIASPEDCVEVNGLVFIQIPNDCITSLIVGHKATSETKSNIEALANNLGCSYYEMHIGRSNSKPYFINSNQSVHTYSGSGIIECDNTCETCNEPIPEGKENCPWCSIEQSHEMSAAGRNPMRMLESMGRLKDYYKKMDEIGKGSDK